MHATLDTLLLFFAILSACFCSSSNTSDASESNIVDEVEALSNFKLCVKLYILFNYINHNTAIEHSIVKDMVSSGRPTIPFEFPNLKSIGMKQALALARAGKFKSDITENQRKIMCVLVLIVYRLLQFHIKRLSSLSSYEYSTPIMGRHTGNPWEDNPENWFCAMWSVILPGFHLYTVSAVTDTIVRRIFVKRFAMVDEGPTVKYEEMLNDTLTQYSMKHSQSEGNSPTIALFTLPPFLFNKRLPPNYTILTFARLDAEEPVARGDILSFLLHGVHLAFTLTEGVIDVVVTAGRIHPPSKRAEHSL